MKLPLLLLTLILTITLIIPTILPAWPREKLVSDRGYLEELDERFGVNHRMKPQLSAGGQIMPIPAPSGLLDVLTDYTRWVCEESRTDEKDDRQPANSVTYIL